MRFRDYPLKTKLIAIGALSIGLGLALSFAVTGWVQGTRHRDALVTQLEAVAQGVAVIGTPAIRSHDDKAADLILQALATRREIADAWIVLARGESLASLKPGHDAPAFAAPADAVTRVNGGLWQRRMLLVRGIASGDEIIGTVLIDADPSGPRAELLRDFGVSAFGVALAFGLACALAIRLQRLISKPILELAEASRRVVLDKRYDLRIEPQGAGEIGGLGEGFNHMLAQIEALELQLAAHRDALEATVEQRTAELLGAKQRAEAESLAKSQFLAHISQEARSPMSGLLGMAALLLDSSLTPRQRHLAGTLRSSADQMRHLLNDILDYSKIGAARREIERIEFDPRQLAADVASLFAERAQRKGLELVCHIEPNVPALVRGDSHRLAQSLSTLVSNAVKFTEHGDIIVMLDHTDGQLRFTVRDTGVGVSRELQARLFSALPQGDDSTTHRLGGTGPGLAITRQRVELMGGQIGIDSETRRGAVFWFSVPVEAATEPRPANAASAALMNRSVLVIEPHPLARAATLAVLQRLGLHATTATDADAALQALARAIEPVGIVLYAEPEHPGPASPFAERVHALRGITMPLLLKLVPVSALAELDAPPPHGPDAWLPRPLTESWLRHVLRDLDKTRTPPGDATSKVTNMDTLQARILVVEDNPINAEIALELLTDDGCNVSLAVNGEDAVVKFRRQRFDLILMDCQMPVMDGYEATRRIREIEAGSEGSGTRRRRTPIVALTANALGGDRDRCIAAGMDDHLGKPFKKTLLRAMVERWAAGAVATCIAEPVPMTLTPDGQRAILDREVLIDNFRIGGRIRYATARRVIALFLEETPRLLTMMTDGLARGEVRTVERAVHTIRSSSAAVGAMSLSQLARSTEIRVSGGDLDGIAACARELELQYELAAGALVAQRDDFPEDAVPMAVKA